MTGHTRQQGLSLVELLVSMAIALLVLAGVVQTFLTSKQAYLYNEQLGFIQENARFALDRIARDISRAGYISTGDCPPLKNRQVGIADTTPEGVTGLAHGFEEPVAVMGYEGAEQSFPAAIAGQVWPGSDAIEIFQAASATTTQVVANHSGTRFTLNHGATHDARPGAVWTVISGDCSQIATFVQSGPANESGGATHVDHQTSNGTDLFNWGTQLNTAPGERCVFYPLGHPSEGSRHARAVCGTGNEIGNNALLVTGSGNVGSKLFYLAPSSVDASIPALYQRVAGRAEELVLGVDDLQLEYGMQQGSGTRYVSASQISDEEDWARVGAVRMQLVLRSQTPVLAEARERTYLGQTYNDRYVRQLVSSTMQIRNVIAE